MEALVTQPLFLVGVVVFVTGVGGVAVTAFGVELGEATSGRPGAIAAVGLVIMAGGWWAAESERLQIAGLRIRWEASGVTLCDAHQDFTGTIETTGTPEPVRYRVISSGTILEDETFTPAGEGTSAIGGRARVTGTQQPIMAQQGVDLYLEILSPVSAQSGPANLAVNPLCGHMVVTPVPRR